MAPKPLVLAIALTQLLAGHLSAQAAIPRSFGELRLGMTLEAFRRTKIPFTYYCHNACLPAETHAQLSLPEFSTIPASLASLGYISDSLHWNDEAIDLTFFHDTLVAITLPPPADSVDQVARLLIAHLGMWRLTTVHPSGYSETVWSDPSSDLIVPSSLAHVPGILNTTNDASRVLFITVRDRRLSRAMETEATRRRAKP
jgi:hypothetical protein